MSNSLLHQEKRRRRARQKAKEGSMMRNSPHHAIPDTEAITQLPIMERPRSLGWWARMRARAMSLFHLFSIGPDTRSTSEKIHRGGWFKRQQEEEAHKKQRPEAER